MGFDTNLQPIDLVQVEATGQPPPITPISVNQGNRLLSKAINDLKGNKERGKKRDVNDLEGMSLNRNALKNAIGSLSPRSVVTSPNTSHMQELSKTITRAGGKTPKGADVIKNRGTNLGGLKEESNVTGRITILRNALQKAIESPLTRPRPVVTSPSAPTVAPTTAPPVCAVVPTASPSASAVIPHSAPAPTPSTQVNLSAPIIYENMKNIAQRYM